ncbi:MAG: hypothetical protein HYV77_02415 [Candidatus Wildermuthbacteria bacterium]|nr:hypothetical protein [Candidatus Wildermuthbacteria bacterium]
MITAISPEIVGRDVKFVIGGLSYEGRIVKDCGECVVVDAEQIVGNRRIKHPILVWRATALSEI